MKTKNIFVLLAVIFFIGCTNEFEDTIRFTEIENPNLSETSLVGQPNSATIWLSGIEREISRTFNELLILSELASDNYVNTQTFYNQFMDNLDIRTTDPDIRDSQNQIARVARMAEFGIGEIGPGDPELTDAVSAEFHFFLGMSRMMSAMYFTALPQETLGVPVASSANYESAITSFNTAVQLNPLPEYHLASARCSYYLGDRASAVSSAEQALAIDNSFLRTARFDNANGPANVMDAALYARATFDDFQPLPSLDFLDPKYSFFSAAEDMPLNYLKAEEAYLILAEASLAADNAAEAQSNLTALLGLVSSRNVSVVDETIEQRSQVAPDSRPNNSAVVVDGRAGLVLDRTASTSVPTVSGTSLTQDDIDNMADDDSGLALVYRTRQEVFIAEAIRSVDMGIKLVIDENEALQNSNVSEGGLGTVPQIPGLFNDIINDIDAFTYDAMAGTVTITNDINSLLVANKTSDMIVPFE